MSELLRACDDRCVPYLQALEEVRQLGELLAGAKGEVAQLKAEVEYQKDRVKNTEKMFANQLLLIPQRTDYHANRYDTDNKIKCHIWDSEGNSYDIEVDKS